MNKKETIIVIVMCFVVLGIVIFTNNSKDNNKNVISYEYILDEKTPLEVIDDPNAKVVNLQSKYNNEDIVANLRILNTNFETPIPQTSNNTYYYRRLPNKEKSIIGSTFMDYRTKIGNSRSLIIYGHNSSKYDMPFKILENYYDKNFYNEHQYIELDTLNGVKRYQIFSVFVETKDFSYYQHVDFKSNSDFYRLATSLKEKSFYDTGVEVLKDDNILILQACSTHKKYKQFKNKFVLIISREVKGNEIN